jgi:hypothetical protein
MARTSDPSVEDRQESGVPTEDREQRIRELAYSLWEKAGRPQGLPIEFPECPDHASDTMTR